MNKQLGLISFVFNLVSCLYLINIYIFLGGNFKEQIELLLVLKFDSILSSDFSSSQNKNSSNNVQKHKIDSIYHF